MKRINVGSVSKKFKIGFVKNQTALSRIMSFSGREPKKTIWALKDMSLDADAGEAVGIIGKNGSGKSTLLRIIARIYKPSEGIIETEGRIISLINLNIGMIDRLSMRDNIHLCCALFNLSRKEIGDRFDSIVEFSELSEFVNTKLYQFSNGMLQRLAFSIAIHCDPEILLVDEVFEVGDEGFKKKSAIKIRELVDSGVTVLFVSHDLGMIEKYCDRVIWMSKGCLKKQGETRKIMEEYKNSEL